MIYGSKGQVSSPKKNHAAAETARDLWLDACLLICGFEKAEVNDVRENEKTALWGQRWIRRASIDLWPGFHDRVMLPQVRTCWGVPSPNPALAFLPAKEKKRFEINEIHFELEVHRNGKKL